MPNYLSMIDNSFYVAHLGQFVSNNLCGGAEDLLPLYKYVIDDCTVKQTYQEGLWADTKGDIMDELIIFAEK